MIDPERNRVAKYLHARLPSFKKEATEKARPRIVSGGGGKKPCPICGKHYGAALKENTKPLCPDCTTKLTEGYCAFIGRDVGDNRFAFLRDERLPADYAGAVFKCSRKRMDEIERIFKMESQTKEGDSNEVS